MSLNKRPWLLHLALACACLIGARTVYAALTLNANSNGFSIPFLTTDYNSSSGAAQVIRTSAHTLTVLSNSSTFTLSMRAQTAAFSFTPSSGDANPSKPAADLAVRLPATSGTWFPLSAASQVVGTGPKANGPQARNVDYRLNSSLATDPPGTYSLSVIYTVTSP